MGLLVTDVQGQTRGRGETQKFKESKLIGFEKVEELAR